MKKVLVACEESQRVCMAFRNLGFDAYSCDIVPCSGGFPEYHFECDVREVLDFDWDIIIAHPPCTYLTNTGNKWFDVERFGERAIERHKLRSDAFDFFMLFANHPCKHIAIENPIGYVSTHYRKPDQIIQPYMFGDPERKSTCLWLKNLPCLIPTCIVEPNIIHYKNGSGTDSPWHMDSMKLPPDERSRFRSKTFLGIANAMAEQWGGFLNEKG